MSRATHPAPEDLLREIRALRSLVVALLGDEHAADDVLQEVWLASEAKQPACASSTWAWLRGLARIEVLRRRRTDRRREARERAAARPEAAPATEHASDRIELARRVLEEVQALEEPYGRAIWLHYFEGLPPREIARRAGVPSETARTWLHRARQKLRERLEARYGSGGAWRLALVPLASPFAQSVVTSTGLLLTAGAIMKAKAVGLAALLLCLSVAGWFAWRTPDFDTSRGSTRDASAAAPFAPKTAANDATVLRSESSEGARDRSTPSPAALSNRRGVLVLDDAETPLAGIPVALLSRDEHERESLLWDGTTGIGGLAPFPKDLEQRLSAPDVDRLVATFRFPLAERRDVALAKGALPDQPIILRMPKTGSMAITFVDEQDRIAPEVRFAMIQGTSAADIESGRTPWRSLLHAQHEAHEGQIFLAFVGVGCRMRVEARYPEDTRVRIEAECSGPAHAGERAEARLRLGVPVPVLVGRLVDEDDTPLAATACAFDCDEHGPTSARGRSAGSRTDVLGRFRYAGWGEALPIPDAKRELLIRESHGPFRSSTRIRLPSPLPAGVTDLGDVVLLAPPSIATGTVVDAEGRARKGVRVRFELEPLEASREKVMGGCDTDDEGCFALHQTGAWRSARIWAESWNGRALCDSVTVMIGTPEATEVRLKLQRESGIRGRVLRDEITARSVFWLHALLHEKATFGVRLDPERPEFALHLPPGEYRVLLDASGRHFVHGAQIERGVAPVLDLRSVHVGPGEFMRDARLEQIDLRGRFRTLRALVLDAHGEPLRHQTLRVAPIVPGTRAGAYEPRSDRDGRIIVPCLVEHDSFLLGHADFPPAALRWQADEQIVRFANSLRVGLELAADAPELAAPFSLLVELEPEDFSPELTAAIGDSPQFRCALRGGRGELRVPCAGRYRVVWILREGLPEGTHDEVKASMRPESPLLEVRELGNAHSFFVAPRTQDIEQAKQRLLKRR